MSIKVRTRDYEGALASARKAFPVRVPFTTLFGAMRLVWEQTPAKRQLAVLHQVRHAHEAVQ